MSAFPEAYMREITAHHEAGHAVAAVVRGGTLNWVSIEPGDDYSGQCSHMVKPWGDDAAFVTFAGPWAEARFQWPLDDIEGLDDDGATFDDFLAAAFMGNIDGDGEKLRAHQLQERELVGPEHAEFIAESQRVRERMWPKWLEDYWPPVQQVAQLLLDGEQVDQALVHHLVAEAEDEICSL